MHAKPNLAETDWLFQLSENIRTSYPDWGSAMIQSIEISNLATFVDGPHEISGLKPINYFFGANGTGKTTISKGIANGAPPKCVIKWQSDLPLMRLVYNRDFVEANFHQTEELKGIFTLGEDEISLLSEIEDQEAEREKIKESIAKLLRARDGDPNDESIEGQKQKQEALDNDFKNACWNFKVKHDKQLKEALRGSIKNKEKFRERALLEIANNQCKEVYAATLAERVEMVFGPDQEALKEVTRPAFRALLDHENAPILKKVVVGREDVDIAALILKLKNSDWVKEGIGYLAKSDGACPFCQQEIPETLKKDFDDYFDETFIANTKAIGTLKTNYGNDVQNMQQQLTGIEQAAPKHLDLEAFKRECRVLDLLLKGNKEHIQKKQDESSRVIALDSTKDASEAILKIIDAANVTINKHNQMIANKAAEQKKLEAEVWRFLLDDGIITAHNDYNVRKEAIDKVKKKLTEQIAEKKRALEKAEEAINDLEKKTTSVEPTVKAINKLLAAFGFRGFSLAMADSKSSYKLIRPNGELAKHTLSEGEKTFVTFLYFYQLLRGSCDGANVSATRVVVFDDPVSSLDSDVLHVVSSLIRELFEEACKGDGLIRQILIFTHNIAFHKEVSYFKSRQKGVSYNKVGFWMVHKREERSQVLSQRSNPVKSFYDTLWSEIRNSRYTSCNIHNTLRRILEQSARLLGGIELKDIEKSFSGAELTACRALLAWANDGSHFCHDDLFVSGDETGVEMFLSVFKLIFEKCGWKSHYDHMMEIGAMEKAKEEETEEGLVEAKK